jgi:hypothetical protein
LNGKKEGSSDKLVRTGIFGRKKDCWSSVKMYISIDDKELFITKEKVIFVFIERLLNIHCCVYSGARKESRELWI